MNEIRNNRAKHNSKPRIKLIRGSDGRLRPSGNDTDIGDIWAEQRRIQLAEAIEEDKKKAARRRLRQERGLLGLAKTELSQLAAKTKETLLGEQPKHKPSTISHPKDEVPTKIVEVKIALPPLPKPNIGSLTAGLKKGAPHISKTATISIVIALAVALVGYHLVANRPNKNAKSISVGGRNKAEHRSTTPASGTPAYLTILPAEKSIQDLGGWARVSPPDHNPVYAFADRIGNTHIDVSEQPLPVNFQADTASQITQLAQSYSANQKLVASGITVYVGTSAQGPQSVIFTEDGLLILIKSTAPVPGNQWIAYVNSLR